MGGDGVSDVSAGDGEGVGGMVNGAGLTLGLLQGWEPVGVETCVDNEFPGLMDLRSGYGNLPWGSV